MPDSVVTATYTDPSTFESAIRSARWDFLIPRGSRFASDLTQIKLPHIGLQIGREPLARVVRGGPPDDISTIYLVLATNSYYGVHNGNEILENQVCFQPAGSEYHHICPDDFRWSDISYSPADLIAVAQTIIGRDVTPPTSSLIRTPRAAVTRRLRDILLTVDDIAHARHREILEHPEVRRAIEHELMLAGAASIAEGQDDSRRINESHLRALRRFYELIDAHKNAPLHTAEICRAIGVSARTLRLICEEQLGMGPIRFLWLRRMHLAHRALLTEPPPASVTDVATGLGFWEMGKFSVAYRSLFGEPPSVTLQRNRARFAVPAQRRLLGRSSPSCDDISASGSANGCVNPRINDAHCAGVHTGCPG